MTEEVERHFAQAAECIEDAQVLLAHDRLTAVVARTYYAMFHAATAVLLNDNIRRSSHHSLLAAFGERLVKTGRISREFFEHLREAFERRQQTDYEPLIQVDRQTAQESIDRAVDFVDACRQLMM